MKCIFSSVGGEKGRAREGKMQGGTKRAENRTGYDKFWFQRADPRMVLPQRLSSDWRWVMCDGVFFLFFFYPPREQQTWAKQQLNTFWSTKIERGEAVSSTLCEPRAWFSASQRANEAHVNKFCNLRNIIWKEMLCSGPRLVRKRVSLNRISSEALVFFISPNFCYFCLTRLKKVSVQ